MVPGGIPRVYYTHHGTRAIYPGIHHPVYIHHPGYTVYTTVLYCMLYVTVWSGYEAKRPWALTHD